METRDGGAGGGGDPLETATVTGVGVVTIDGPAASGKSSVAREVAARLGLPFVSSGLLYRAATWLVLDHGVDPGDAAAVATLARRHRVTLHPETGGNRIEIDGRDVTGGLHTDAVDAAVSAVAAHPELRAWVKARLREVDGDFVVEGRDMGTAVFPEANHKFYLNAPAAVRARRRVGEREADLAQVTTALERRDRLDARQLSPAPDAVHLETGTLSLEQVVDAVLTRLGNGGRS